MTPSLILEKALLFKIKKKKKMKKKRKAHACGDKRVKARAADGSVGSLGFQLMAGQGSGGSAALGQVI